VEEVQMISHSIYVRCTEEQPLPAVLQQLGIAQENISSYAKGADYLEHKQNGALVEKVKGDFTDAVDFHLFDRTLDLVEEAFLSASEQGVDIAMSVEEDEDPEVFHLWRGGKKLLVRIINDEYDEDVLRVLDPLSEAGLQ
jgi:hypothetical protein